MPCPWEDPHTSPPPPARQRVSVLFAMLRDVTFPRLARSGLATARETQKRWACGPLWAHAPSGACGSGYQVDWCSFSSVALRRWRVTLMVWRLWVARSRMPLTLGLMKCMNQPRWSVQVSVTLVAWPKSSGSNR